MFRSLVQRAIGLSASPRAPFWLAFVSFGEASFLPVPPDLLLVPMVLARPARAWRLAALCTLASVAGACLGYVIGAQLFDLVARPVMRFYHSEAALDHFQQMYRRWGAWVILIKGLTPIPFKIVTIASGAARFDVPTFLLACAVTRGARFFILAALLRRYGDQARVVVERHAATVLAGMACLAAIGVVLLRYV